MQNDADLLNSQKETLTWKQKISLYILLNPFYLSQGSKKIYIYLIFLCLYESLKDLKTLEKIIIKILYPPKKIYIWD